MTPRYKKAFKSLALLLALSVSQVYVQVNLAAGPSPAPAPLPIPAQAVVGKLITRGNQSVIVNGNAATSGATIMTGATIETGDQVGATIDLGSLGTVELAPNTKAVLDYSDGQVRVKIITGCAIVRTKKNTTGEVTTDQGSAAKTDPKGAGLLNVCLPPGATSPVINTATTAGGVSSSTGGLSTAVIATTVAGAIGAVIVGAIAANHSSGNPSGSTP